MTGPVSSASFNGERSPTSKTSMTWVSSGVASWRRRMRPPLGESAVVSRSAPTNSAPLMASAMGARSAASMTSLCSERLFSMGGF